MTTTTIRCGHCKQGHATPAEVRACYGVPLNDLEQQLAASLPEPDLVAVFSKASEPEPTDKQLAFIERLYAERPSFERRPVRTRLQASTLIDQLLATPKEVNRGAAGDNSVSAFLQGVPDGYYALPSKTGTNDLDFIVVTTSRSTQNPAAKGRRYVNRYLGGQGVIRISMAEQFQFARTLRELHENFGDGGLQSAMRLFGIELGRCGRCGLPLTDEASRARGIGPTCWSRL